MSASAATEEHGGRPVIWQPNTGPQTRFLATSADEVLYGGQAGGGKSAALVAMPLRWCDNPHFRALILRRETTDLGNLLDQAAALYPKAFPGATPKQTGAGALWRFPSGATVWFNHCQHEKDAAAYDGFEFQLIEFDELTHFTEKQYRALRARIRSSQPGLPRFTRSTTNPGGDGHEWVFKRWAPWLDPKCEAEGLALRFDEHTGARLPPARPGEVLWYVPTDGGEAWVPRGTTGALSRSFIPARISDNPHLLRNDPNYVTTLGDLDPVRRAQLRDGDWLVKPAAGLYFKRGWFGFLEVAPVETRARVRYWDLAGSKKATGDYAAGCKMSMTPDRRLVIEHMAHQQGTPGDTRKLVRSIAETDGKEVPIVIEQDPGQAGADQALTYAQLLMGWNIVFRPKRVDKITAAGPLSAQAQAGNVVIVKGPWVERFFGEAESFPEGDHDDQVDAASGASAVVIANAFGIDLPDMGPMGSRRTESDAGIAGAWPLLDDGDRVPVDLPDEGTMDFGRRR